MQSYIEQHVWTLLEDLGHDLENDNDASEKCDKCVDNIINLINKRQNEKTTN